MVDIQFQPNVCQEKNEMKSNESINQLNDKQTSDHRYEISNLSKRLNVF